MNTTAITEAENGTLQHVFRTANRLWRRTGVRGVDRKDLLTELEAELDGARRDGHSASTVLGEDSALTLRQWADERDLSGRALRLTVVVPVALLGVAAGLAVVLLAVFAAFSDRPTIDFGPFVLPMYASAGLFAYLCALLSVWVVLRRDPHASSTIRWLAVLLPLGAIVCSGTGIAIAWWRNFNTSSTVFAVVITAVVLALGMTVGIARYVAVRSAHGSATEDRTVAALKPA
ncbi:hypothetical protein [Rhodococcus sp. 1168]|uniref:hypothetical protein n=1 Tax=Rhodococcus sp. 1168 TaxID=2018041 RepID=UPI000A0AB28C|nr:hypothetical protein [Rhodococcus sp. 1168]ORI22656.1 hypothetical protein BJI47_18895 [Rhodococcus sp. 1168]